MTATHRPTRRVRMLRSDERARDRAAHRMFAEPAPAPEPIDCRLAAKWIRAQLRRNVATVSFSRHGAAHIASLLEGSASMLERGNG